MFYSYVIALAIALVVGFNIYLHVNAARFHKQMMLDNPGLYDRLLETEK